jgi:hypothetical protein
VAADWVCLERLQRARAVQPGTSLAGMAAVSGRLVLCISVQAGSWVWVRVQAVDSGQREGVELFSLLAHGVLVAGSELMHCCGLLQAATKWMWPFRS